MDYNLVKKHLTDFEKQVVKNPTSWHLYAYVQHSQIVKELKKLTNEAIPIFGKFLSEDSLTNNKDNLELREELEEAWITLFIIFIIEFKLDKVNQPSMFESLEEWRKWSISIISDN